MNLEKYPHTDEEINIWNSYLNRSKIFPIELLINKNNKNFINLQKIFETLKLDKVKPKVFIESYINAKTNYQINIPYLAFSENGV